MKDSTKKTDDDVAYDKVIRATRKVLELDEGRDFIWEILGLTGLYTPSFTGNSTTFFNEGKRSIGLDLLALMNDADPQAYAKMQIEQSKLED